MNQAPHFVVPVILAGGSGTRLWALSRTDYPKQYLTLGNEQSLLQATVERFSNSGMQPPLVVCSERHRFLAPGTRASLFSKHRYF